MGTIYALLCLFFLALAVFFNGIETGLISLDRLTLEQESKNNKSKRALLRFIEKPELIFGTALLGQNISIVIFTSLVTVYFFKYIAINEELLSLMLAGFVLVVAEIIPKSITRDYANYIVPIVFPVLRFFSYFLRPFIIVVSWLNTILEKVFKINNNAYQAFTKDDLAYLLSQTNEDELLQQPQKEMLEDALEFNELVARNVMRPRTDIIAIPEDYTLNEIVEIAREEGYTRYPVYNNTIDNVTGILIIYDLIRYIDNQHITAKQIKREAYFAPESMDIDVLLRELQTNKKSMAIVVDSYGGTAGIVTVEDILEEIVGEIEDEYDIEEEKDVEIISPNLYIVRGFVDVDTLNDEYDMELPEGDYETIAGLIIAKLERIPTQGQTLVVDKIKIEVLQVTNKKIIKVRLSKHV